ncbi:unnamed protein product, partial [Amoebophrya sp. A120]
SPACTSTTASAAASPDLKPGSAPHNAKQESCAESLSVSSAARNIKFLGDHSHVVHQERPPRIPLPKRMEEMIAREVKRAAQSSHKHRRQQLLYQPAKFTNFNTILTALAEGVLGNERLLAEFSIHE